MRWGFNDIFTRGRLLSFVCMGRKEGRLPKQSSHSYKHGKEKKKKRERKKRLEMGIHQATRVAVERPRWRDLL